MKKIEEAIDFDKNKKIMKIYDILEEILYKSRELFCMHCNTKINKNYATIHKGECYCAKCQDWNMIEDCRKDFVVVITDNLFECTTHSFHKCSVTYDKLYINSNDTIMDIENITKIVVNNEVVYT